ncbi:hypothetical protein [Vibrio phage XM1]|uniref:Uncharacterized protein n=1 Tax=Vibrio phage XM1 TaxID=2748688 RepID=UPI0015F23BF3|nr:Chain A3, Collar spike protein [Vibrio phage XM1]7KJK_B3 Chain B3, Collar spike protein [Vibrio phage XM1]7KJK_C3 Chain C3, Collar spike protein [Vibrio phage XM1]7KJK_D3 Chain D3, Collar spike protein [Vibrio phage XM1]7KJK_E3 Chain E3, Collar spike protein [Vibrio phage XM1]7KJK_F3 Chain F3, Collar spike protein [Vibrio phage XM1]7KJK_G3 Chain G3, Collar spike protein [Vibrio phage XM1]7KJK_H3 Chain H3, Collar spike protein [Vibrio phage XM1]7KJK_I3 Chain I3, Collar spike protein [Vibr
MSIQVTGIIEGPLGTPSPGITIRVVSKISYRNTYRLSTEDYVTTTGGAYDFQLNEGFHKILIRYRGASSFTKLGDVSVSDQTPSPITLINLLESSSPKALVVKLQELADEASESAQSASDDADQVTLDKQQVTLLAQQVSDDADQVALDRSATAQSEVNAAQSATTAQQSADDAAAIVPNLQSQIDDKIDKTQSIIPDVDALFSLGRHEINPTNNNIPGLSGTRSLLHIQNNLGGFQLAARTVGSEIHVRSADTNSGNIGPWERLYTTGYRPSSYDLVVKDKAEALSVSHQEGLIIGIESCNGARFVSVLPSDSGGLYLGSLPNGNKLRHIPLDGFSLKTIRTSDFEINSGSDVSQFLIDASTAGYGQVYIDNDCEVTQLCDITGVKYLESLNGAEMLIDDLNGRVKCDTDGFEVKGIVFKKSGDYSNTTFEAYLLETNGEKSLASRCQFVGQWAGYKLQGNDSSADLCFFSDGTFMLRVGEGVSSCNINRCFFTRGTRRFTEGEQQGDGIKLTAQSSTQGYNENIIISDCIFYDTYRDCIDGYVGANRLIVKGSIMLNWGAHALDFKSRVDDNSESPDGGPLTRNVLVDGCMIWKDVVRPDFDLTLAAVVMSVIPGALPVPTSEADVRQNGLRGMELKNTLIAYKGNGSLISAASTWRTVIDGCTLTDLGQIGQIIYAPNSWHLKLINSTVNIDPSNINNVKFSSAMNNAEVNDNTFNRLLISTDGMIRTSIKRNKFNGEGVLSRGLNIASEEVSAVSNEFENFTSFGAQIFNSASKCRFDFNEIRNCPAPLGIENPSVNTYHSVRGNISMGSGAFTGLNRITDNGGVANGNDHVPYS